MAFLDTVGQWLCDLCTIQPRKDWYDKYLLVLTLIRQKHREIVSSQEIDSIQTEINELDAARKDKEDENALDYHIPQRLLYALKELLLATRDTAFLSRLNRIDTLIAFIEDYVELTNQHPTLCGIDPLPCDVLLHDPLDNTDVSFLRRAWSMDQFLDVQNIEKHQSIGHRQNMRFLLYHTLEDEEAQMFLRFALVVRETRLECFFR